MANKRLAQTLSIADAARIGVVDFEIAAVGTAYNAANGWRRVGTLEPGSYKPDLGREKYHLEVGLPKTPVKGFVVGQKGTIGMNVLEYTAKGIEVANGGNSLTRTTGTSTTVAAGTISKTSFPVASAAGLAVGTWIAITLSAIGITEDRKITAINGTTITVDELPATPVATDVVAPITGWSMAGGGTKIVQYAGRMIFTDTYGDQAVRYFPLIEPTGKLAEDFGDGTKVVMLPLEFDVYGSNMTVNGDTDLFLYVNYMIPATGGTAL